jgi:PII-like signaling protein
MKGYQLTFYTQQDRLHGKESLAEWLLKLAKEQGALGGTLFSAGESFGHDGRFHSAHFFELADQPVGVVAAVDEATCTRVLEALRRENIDVFFVKTPVEYGRTGSYGARKP